MDHRHHPLGGPPGGHPPRAGHPDDRDRAMSSGPQKRTRMDTRTPPNGEMYSHLQQQQQQHIQHGIQRQYKEVSRSPEVERMAGPGLYRPTPPPPHPSQQQRHESVPQSNPIHPGSNRGSPFMPPHRTSTPESHQRVPPVHNSPHLFRGPPPPPPPSQESMMQQSLQQQHAQHPQHHRGMPPPSSPHHNPIAPPQQMQPQRQPPPSHHSSGPPPSFSQGPASGSGRDLPSLSSLSSSRPSMSISSMLGSSDPPAAPSHAPHPSSIPTHSLPLSSSRPQDFSPLKRPYTPDLNGVPSADRDRQVNSSSASPSTASGPLVGFPGPKSNRAMPDQVYRAHNRLQYESLAHSRERDHQQADIMGAQGQPPRPMPQPLTSNQSISNVLQEESQRPMMPNNDPYSDRRRRYESEWQLEKERERERERHLERERQREEEINRERERERELREREIKEREREREREKARIRERVNTMHVPIGQQVFGRESHRHEHQHQPPQTSSSHLSYPMTATAHQSRMSAAAGQDPMAGPPPVSVISTSSTMALPQTSTSGLGPTPAPLPTATTTGREGYQSFTGYTTPMPPSPFAITASLPVLPPVIEGSRDSRRQGFPLQAAGPSFGRDEPTRAEDALQRGLSRQSSGLAEEDRRRRAEKDRDGLMRDRDGHARINGPNMGNQSPPKRGGLGGMEISSMTRNWSEDFQKELMENNREREREDAGKLALGKRERATEEDESAKMEKKTKKNHTHHHGPHQHMHHISVGAHHHHHHHHHNSSKPEDDNGTPNLEVPISRAGARSKSPNSLVHMHSHMHNHAPLVHHHHNIHHVSAVPAVPVAPPQRIKTSLLIDSSKVLASLSSKPRHYLGSIIYHPTPTPKQGYSITQPLLPRFEGKENSIFQVRIPRRFLSEQQRRDVHRRRCVWGTEVYTDDSDVLGVLVHLGKVPGVLPDGVDSSLVAEAAGRRIVMNGITSASPRSPPISSPVKKKVNGVTNGKADKQQAQDGPTIPASKDLIVNLLILPTLEKYTGSTRNALKSRSWNTIHDGMSYSIWDMEWVDAGEAEARGGGSKKRRLDEREWVRRWGELPPSRGGMGKNGWGKNRWSVGDSRAGSKGKVAEVGA